MENLEILFEDSDIIIAVKPIGVLSQSDDNGKPNMISFLNEYTKGTVYPLHRLDKDVSGVMVYAKNKLSAAVLSKDISQNLVKKEYLALVHGKPLKSNGEMHDLLFKDSTKQKSFVVKKERKGVKKASLEYQVLNTVTINNEEYSLVKILLHTGRTHQIRVQFSSRKMSLAGDKKYGAKDEFKNIGLWSYSLRFNHPKTKKEVYFYKLPNNYISDYLA